MARALLSRRDKDEMISMKDTSGSTALLWAGASGTTLLSIIEGCASGYTEVVKLSIAAGAV